MRRGRGMEREEAEGRGRRNEEERGMEREKV